MRKFSLLIQKESSKENCEGAGIDELGNGILEIRFSERKTIRIFGCIRKKKQTCKHAHFI